MLHICRLYFAVGNSVSAFFGYVSSSLTVDRGFPEVKGLQVMTLCLAKLATADYIGAYARLFQRHLIL